MTEAMRCLASGPGNWCLLEDLERLNLIGFPAGARTIQCTSQAAKLRVLHSICPQARNMLNELMDIQVENLRRPLGPWHRRSFVEIIVHNEDALRNAGITLSSIEQSLSLSLDRAISFQAAARQAITNPKRSLDALAHRIRHKLQRWKLQVPPGILVQRVFRNFKLLGQTCRPCVLAMQWRTLWNGWPTSARMRSLTKADVAPCLFGCGSGLDRIEHCAVCEVAWSYLGASWPFGFGLQPRLRCLVAFLGLERDLDQKDRRRLATAVYAVARAVQSLRQESSLDPRPLLRLYCSAV